MLTGETVNDDGFAEIMKDVPRMLNREWQNYGTAYRNCRLVLIEFYPCYRTNHYPCADILIYLLDDGNSIL